MNVIELAIASRIRKADDMRIQTNEYRIRIFYPNKSINPENAIENFLNRNQRDGFLNNQIEFRENYILIMGIKRGSTEYKSDQVGG